LLAGARGVVYSALKWSQKVQGGVGPPGRGGRSLKTIFSERNKIGARGRKKKKKKKKKHQDRHRGDGGAGTKVVQIGLVVKASHSEVEWVHKNQGKRGW